MEVADKQCNTLKPATTVVCNRARCKQNVAFVSMRLKLKVSLTNLEADTDLKDNFIRQLRTSVARILKILLERITIHSLKGTTAVAQRRLSSSDSAIINIEIGPVVDGSVYNKSPEECAAELTTQATDETSELRKDTFMASHLSAGATNKWLAASTIRAGEQTESTFTTLETRVATMTAPTSAPTPSPATEASGDITIVAAALSGAVVVTMALGIWWRKRHRSKKMVEARDRVASASELVIQTTLNPMRSSEAEEGGSQSQDGRVDEL